MGYIIEMMETQEQPTLIMKAVTPVGELPKILGKAFMEIVTHIMELGEQPVGPAFVGYFNMDMERLELEIGFPVSKALPGQGDILAGSIPAGKQVSCMYKGPYMEMPPAYEEIQKWIEDNGYKPLGPVYEHYYNSPEEVPESELLTKIVFLVE
ncbi:GyrI-like domain-containing protein [uncultured Trichococcus sp.]|uniref:GyrI-like domain-containing protein n=1 Tax=uncultured Trichococcus sp. TaxID=189665 RepID=UPI002A188C30|nr:GyrI-like domain-containing protein [uncultured Trichococcus sp.]